MNGSRVNNALTVYYDEVIEKLVKSLKASISAAPKLPQNDAGDSAGAGGRFRHSGWLFRAISG